MTDNKAIVSKFDFVNGSFESLLLPDCSYGMRASQVCKLLEIPASLDNACDVLKKALGPHFKQFLVTVEVEGIIEPVLPLEVIEHITILIAIARNHSDQIETLSNLVGYALFELSMQSFHGNEQAFKRRAKHHMDKLNKE